MMPSVWTTTDDFSVADLILPSVGDPEEPLDLADERRIGAKYLDLRHLAAFHFTARDLRWLPARGRGNE